MEDNDLGVVHLPHVTLLPSDSVEQERRLHPHKEHIEDRFHTLKHMLGLLGVIEIAA
jgi:hypothetical protein